MMSYMLLRPSENSNCFPFSYIFCKGLSNYSPLALLPVLVRLIFPHVTLIHLSPSKAEPAMMTPVGHHITQKSLLAFKDPQAPILSHLPIQNSCFGQQNHLLELIPLLSPFMFSHTCHWLGCFSSPISKSYTAFLPGVPH